MTNTISGTYGTLVTLATAADNPTSIISTATLTGGLLMSYADMFVLNGGSISGPLVGVSFSADGFFGNEPDGIVEGYLWAIGASAGVEAAVINTGTVAGGRVGVYLDGGGYVSNLATGTISGTGGIDARDGALTVANTGRITAFDDDGIVLGDGGAVNNGAGGTINAGFYGVLGSNATPTVYNAGYLHGSGGGIYLETGGGITNVSGATLLGGKDGVYGNGAAVTVTNTGTIEGTSRDGIRLLAGGIITNQSGGTISGTEAIYASGTLSVVNAGKIAGFYDGIRLDAGGSVTNQSGGTIAGYYGIREEAQPLTVLNAGTIAGGSGFGISLFAGGDVTNQGGGTISGRLGILDRAGALTVENAGTVSATQFAVYFAAGYTNRLIVDPGAAFVGQVSGGDTASGTATSTLELTSAIASGTLSGLGVQFTGFSQIAIDAGASWTLTGANTLAAVITVTNAGTLTLQNATLSDVGDFINNGVILLDPSNITLADLTGTGVTTIQAGSTLNVLGAVAITETIAFAGANDLLGANPSAFAGQIDGFTFGDTIQLAGVLDGTSAEIVNGNTLQVDRSGNPPIDLTLDPSVSYAGDLYTVSSAGAVTEIPCFLRDTRIRTTAGDVAVQDLTIGDRVLTQSGQSRPITWIGTGRVLVSPGRRSAATPVIVRKGALGDNIPHQDLRLTKGHSLFVDGVLIPAEFLINHRSILWDDHKREVEFYHIELDAHDVLIANSAPSESYRDDGNRWLFQKANSGWDHAAKPPCAPVLTGGPIVDAAWKRLLDRTAPRPGLTLTEDPDLHLLLNGRRLDATTRTAGTFIFVLPHPHAAIRIVSRTAVPQELGLARDPRCLGVALRRLVIRQHTRFRTIDAHDRRLIDGFHTPEPEAGIRWTDGEATLPAAVFKGFGGPVELVLTLGGTTRYPAFAPPMARLRA